MMLSVSTARIYKFFRSLQFFSCFIIIPYIFIDDKYTDTKNNEYFSYNVYTFVSL